MIQETKVAQLEAERKEQELQVSVRKPADAAAYEKRTVAQAQRDADIAASEARARQVELQAEADTKRITLQATAQSDATRMLGQAEAAAIEAKGVAEGEATKAKLMAEAQAIRARADALAENQDAVIGQQLAENWPAIVEAASKAFNNIDQMIVLNGAAGIGEIMAQIMGQGASGLQFARSVLAASSRPENAKAATNGAAPNTPLPDAHAPETRSAS